MQFKMILNRVQRFKSFVYGAVRWGQVEPIPALKVEVHPRGNSRGVCSGCGRCGSGYDRLPTRRFEFVPLWGMKVFLVYAPLRMSCSHCGVKVEWLPWAMGKSPLTEAFAWFLAEWAKGLSWKEVAEAFHTRWDTVFSAVEMAVSWGGDHLDLTGIQSIGIDAVAWQTGHRYLKLVYQIDGHCERLLWIGEKRTMKTLLRCFRWLGREHREKLRFVCSDMWKPYLKVIAKKARKALHVLDRFYICAHLSQAIDEVRAQEARRLKAKGEEPVLTQTRWLLLKRPERLTAKQNGRLAEWLRHNLKTVRAYLLKEDFPFFWSYRSPYWAGRFLDRWCSATSLAQIEPMKRVARMLRVHRHLLLNWFRAKGQRSSGVVEGFNAKVKLTTRKARTGFEPFVHRKSPYIMHLALYPHCSSPTDFSE